MLIYILYVAAMLICFAVKADMSSMGGLRDVSVENISQSSVIVVWDHMRNKIPLARHQYYSYYVQYKQTIDSDWTTERIVQYNPDNDPPQATLDGLTASTEYQVRVLGIRTLNGNSDETENPESTKSRTFTTLTLVGERSIVIT